MADARILGVGVTLATLILRSWSDEHKKTLKNKQLSRK